MCIYLVITYCDNFILNALNELLLLLTPVSIILTVYKTQCTIAWFVNQKVSLQSYRNSICLFTVIKVWIFQLISILVNLCSTEYELMPENDICFENGITRETLTYKEMTQYMVNVAASLLKLGVKRGDVIAIGSEPFLHYVPTTLAVTMTGAACTYFDIDSGEAILKHKLQLAKPTFMISSSQFWQKYQDVVKSCGSIKTYLSLSDIPGMSLKSCMAVDVETFKPSSVQGKTDTALILYSSGTTAMPKGVEVTHYGCIARCGLNLKSIPLKRGLFISPFSAGFTIFGICKFLLLGRSVVYTSDRSTETLLNAIRNCKVDVILSNPVHIRDLANSKVREDHMDSVKVIVCAGFAVSADIIQMFKERFPRVERVVQSYGMTEISASSELYAPAYKPGSVGFVAPGLVIKIVDPDTKSILGINQPGEICVKGTTIMKGYIDTDPSNYMDEEGFYRTGDIGYFDDEKYLYVVDRIKDLIFSKFAKVSPLEIEHVILQHPAVLDVGVVGKPDPVLNEVPAAFVVKKPGCDVSESELMDFIETKGSPHMQLKGGVRFIEKIPRNNTGKTLRRELKDILEETD